MSPWSGDSGIYIFFPLRYICYIPNLLEIGQVVLEKMLTHTTRRQLIALGHLSDYGDPKGLADEISRAPNNSKKFSESRG